jgi:hypothetical protein
MFKETIKDFGRKIIGQGPEVDFKNEVAKYAADFGVSPEEAQKVIFMERMSGVQNEIRLNGNIDGESMDYRNFQAALNELFDSETIEKFKVDAVDPRVSRILPLRPISPRDLSRMTAYYQKKFDGRSPDYRVVKDTVENTQMIDELLRRFISDPALSSRASLERILAVRPELGADLGKILMSRESTEKHSRMFGRELKFENSMNRFKQDATESLTTMSWKAPADWTKDMLKGGSNPNFNNFAKMVESTFRFTGRELWAGSKLLVSTARTAGSYLNTLRR